MKQRYYAFNLVSIDLENDIILLHCIVEVWSEYVGYDVADLVMSPVSHIQSNSNNYISASEHPVTCNAIKVT